MAVIAALVHSGKVAHTNILLTMCLCESMQQLQQLQQQQNLNLQQFVLVQPGHHIATQLQPTQFIISQTPQGQQSESGVLLTSSDLFYPLLSDCFVLPLALNRSPASPEPSNSATSKPSQPPAYPAKHHTCHTGQGYPIYPLDPFLFSPIRESAQSIPDCYLFYFTGLIC